MKHLYVAATKKELSAFLAAQKIEEQIEVGKTFELGNTDILITGVGLLATAFHMARALQHNSYEAIWNFGIAGSFKKELSLGSVVCITEEALADFGAERGDSDYIDMFDMKLLSPDSPPYKNKKLNPLTTKFSGIIEDLPKVSSVTVNTVLSYPQSIQRVINKHGPDVINMEGAAVFYASMMNNIECIGIRSISDYVIDRDRSKWEINLAIDNLNKEISRIHGQRTTVS